MSGKQNENNFPDATGKITDEDKCGFYESSRTDSGFISGEITSEEIIHPDQFTAAIDSGIVANNSDTTKTDSGIIEDKDKYMRLDSGVCLSQEFSNLNLKPGRNNLSGKNIITPVESSVEVDVAEDIPWKIYYEQDDDGDTHLHTSIVEGFVEVALALIRAAPHPRLLDTPNDDAQTPLHLAVETKHWQIARWLRVAGARPCPRDIRGDSPLHIAARNGDLRCIKAITDPVQLQEREAMALSYQAHLYQPHDLNQWNYIGQTCVHMAALYGHTDVLRHLVWYGADVNAREGLEGYTALHYAVQRRDEPMINFLLTECNTLKAEVTTYRGRNALQLNYGIIPTTIKEALRSRGLPSPYSSDEEIDESDSEDENLPYENKHMFVSNLVNASA